MFLKFILAAWGSWIENKSENFRKILFKIKKK